MDMRRFHAAFFEESREGLDAMEVGLLAMDEGRADGDTIHVVFRAAHSIKGGAGTFGFGAISDFTHVLETLLDEARAGKRTLGSDAVSALLGSVDVLRGLMDAAESGAPLDHPEMAQVRASLDKILSGATAAAPSAAKAAESAAPDSWRVTFRTLTSMFLSGNDPLRMLREFDDHGISDVTCLDETLPAFAALDPVQSYLGWTFTLPGTLKKALIVDVFAWVEDECTLEIVAVGGAAAVAVAEISNAPKADNAPGVPAQRTSDNDGSIRVAVTKVDALINLVGELVITQAMLQQRASGLDPVMAEGLLAGLAQLERNTRDLQESVMSVRMLPVDFAFSRFPRMIRDLAARLDKKVRLRMHGESTELDKGVIEKIVDPLVHLVRNSIDHGLEQPAERVAAGKDETGTITLTAAHQGGHIVIEVSDDGRGLNRERILRKAVERDLPLPENPTDAQIWDLVFHPGFSTADALTDVSGRGVGMDVVKKNITALGGSVEISSRAGQGSTVSIRLPLTLAILDGMSVAVGDEVFIVPLNVVVESLQMSTSEIRTIGGNGSRVLRLRNDYIPMLNLREQYRLPVGLKEVAAPIAVVVESEGRRLALEVDELLGQQQVVIKNLETNYRRVPGVSGATILGDGRVALIVDADGLAQFARLPDAA